MDLVALQLESWQCAEAKGLHENLDNGVTLGQREKDLVQMAYSYARETYITQHIKRTGAWPLSWGEYDSTPLDQLPTSAHATVLRLVLVHAEVDEAIEQSGDVPALMEELADILIRVADLAQTVSGNLDAAVQAKLSKNWQRERYYGTPQAAQEPA